MLGKVLSGVNLHSIYKIYFINNFLTNNE